jgi:predicted nicotinamide N-methyase
MQADLQELGRRYRLRKHEVELGSMSLAIWSTTGVDELVNDDTDLDEIPYWAELWPSSIALAKHLLREKDLSDKKILELGCGTALPSIVAGHAGAEVVATDYFEDALAFASANAELNNVHNIRFQLADWRRFDGHLGNFDLVVGADILYERKLHKYLEEVLAAAVSDDGRIVVADPCRPAAIDFMAHLEGTGWSIEMSEQHLPGMKTELVMIYTLTKKLSVASDHIAKQAAEA